jgi:hypothetical protein
VKSLVFGEKSLKEAFDLVDLGCTARLCVKSPRSDHDLLFFVDSSRFPGNHLSRRKISGIRLARAEGV